MRLCADDGRNNPTGIYRERDGVLTAAKHYSNKPLLPLLAVACLSTCILQNLLVNTLEEYLVSTNTIYYED